MILGLVIVFSLKADEQQSPEQRRREELRARRRALPSYQKDFRDSEDIEYMTKGRCNQSVSFRGVADPERDSLISTGR